MYHPLLIFEGGSGILLASVLRPGDVGGIRGLLPRLRLLVTHLRQRWPKRPIALRADGEFAKPTLLDYAEYAGCLSSDMGKQRGMRFGESKGAFDPHQGDRGGVRTLVQSILGRLWAVEYCGGNRLVPPDFVVSI